MKLKYRFLSARQFLGFAFYPRTTILLCLAATVVADLLLGWAMSQIPREFGWYDVLFAILTGMTASFFVSIVVEMSSNYRHNLLAWHELQPYYSIIIDYEITKQALMGTTSSQRAERQAREDFLDDGGMLEDVDCMETMDIVQATWKQLPKIIPELRKNLESKKAFLSDDEINELEMVMSQYKEIRYMVSSQVRRELLYDALNHPDEEFLSSFYPQNVISGIPDWVRKAIASNENQKAIDSVTDAIMQDSFLLNRYMADYDVSEHAIESYRAKLENIENDLGSGDETDSKSGNDIEETDPGLDDFEDEASFRAEIEAMNQQEKEREMPFVSWVISNSCREISLCIDKLEKSLKKIPYVGLHFEVMKDLPKSPHDSLRFQYSYTLERERLETELEQQTKEQISRLLKQNKRI